MRFIKVTLLFTLLLSLDAHAVELKVRIFSTLNISKTVVTPDTGVYYLLALSSDLKKLDTIYDMIPEDSSRTLYFQQKGKEVLVSRSGEMLGKYAAVYLKSSHPEKEFRVDVNRNGRVYHGNLQVRVFQGYLQLVNIVNMEHYVAGVVESEGGHVDKLEFFKAQAILARTFALKNLEKHKSDGYNLKDDVTSQVYFSKCHYKNKDSILKAVWLTRDTILVTPECEPILGVFHANSGGFTCAANDVWLTSLDYLKMVPDSFSVGVGSYSWTKEVNKESFFKYYASSLGVSNTASLQKDILNFNHSNGRQAYFRYSNKKLKLTRVRSRFKLKSTYFTVEDKGESLILHGKGFGHGVGMAQDGAINMAAKGYDYREILYFYYSDVELEDLKYLIVD